MHVGRGARADRGDDLHRAGRKGLRARRAAAAASSRGAREQTRREIARARLSLVIALLPAHAGVSFICSSTARPNRPYGLASVSMHLEVIVALRRPGADRLAGGLHRGREVARLALELRRLQRAVGTITGQLSLSRWRCVDSACSISSVNFT